MVVLLAVVISGCGDSGTASPATVPETSAERTMSRGGNDVLETAATDAMHLTELETPQEDSSQRGVVRQTKVPASAAPVTAAPAAAPASDRDTELSPEEVVAAIESVMIGVYEKALPSVVHIHVVQGLSDGGNRNPLLPQDFMRQGEGSGFVWDDDGHVVTNHHVVEGVDSVTVNFADGTRVSATVLGGDPGSDLAVLRLDEEVEHAVPITLGDSDEVRVGQTAIAIGAPFSQEFTMTSGIVSAVGRTIRSGASLFSMPGVIQTDAAINPGNSGGPLFDRHGRVIAINTQIISRSGSNAGVALAVPVNTARRVVPALIEDGKYEHSWLGISGQDVHSALLESMDLPTDSRGAHVIAVQEGSPADKAGLRGSDGAGTSDGVEYPSGGDIIVGVDGEPMTGMTDLIFYLSDSTRPGDSVTLEVLRDGEVIELEVTLAARP